MKHKYIKTGKLLAGLCFVALSSISCHDILNVTLEGQLTTDDIFANSTYVGAYANTCYEGDSYHANEYRFRTNLPILLSDDAHDYGTSYCPLAYGGMTVDNNWLLKDGTWGGVNTTNLSWTYLYCYIAKCNEFISRIDDATVDSEDDRKAWKAEMRVLRAHYYHELITRFGDVPLLTDPVVIGDTGSDLVRTDYHIVADFIISECEDALLVDEFPWRYTSNTNIQRMNKAVAAALISRIALYAASPLFADDAYTNDDGEAHDWQWAMTKTKESLDLCLENGYELWTTTNTYSAPYDTFNSNPHFAYGVSTQDFSTNPTDKESILVSRSSNMGKLSYIGYPQVEANKCAWCPSQELVDSYPMTNGKYVVDPLEPYNDDDHLDPNYVSDSGYDANDPYVDRDPRFYSAIMYNGVPAKNKLNTADIYIETYNGGLDGITMGNTKYTSTGYYVRKYTMPTASGQNVGTTTVSFKLMTVAELYLNYAEAAIQCDKFAEAEAAIEPIRNRVGMPSIELQGKDKDMAFAMVQNERRIELALQENRYNDIRRWTLPGNDMKWSQVVTGMWIEKEDDGSFSYHRLRVGQEYDKTTGEITGTPWTRDTYKAQYLLHGLEKEEVARLNAVTGDEWQNPGW
ncbi:MAG: RagB/SusD family nutrient uptake outer membrane protein [Rikenellaceae bacterium]